MRKITTTLTYRVEAGPYCNLYKFGSATPDPKNVCRFCVKNNQGGYTCAMYNELLSSQGKVVEKLSKCSLAMCKGKDEVEDLASVAATFVDPKKMIADIIKQYQITVDSLVGQGFPADIAADAARQMMTTTGDINVSTRR